MQQRKGPNRSRSRSNQSATTRRTPVRRGSKRRGLLAKLGYKRVGFAFIFIGLAIGSFGGILFWQQVDALSTKGWTYVGMASQYQAPVDGAQDTSKERVIVNVYACKVPAAGTEQLFNVKSYASIVHNSVKDSFSSPRLEILARESGLKRYSTGEPVSKPMTYLTKAEAPLTSKAFPAKTVLYYGFNNYFQDQTSGTIQYAIGSINNLLDC